MFRFGINPAGGFQFRSIPRWQIVILSVLGVALGVILALFMLGLLLVAVPVVLVGGLLTRWFIKSNLRSSGKQTVYEAKSSPVSPQSGLIIDAEYEVIEKESPSQK